MPTESIYQPSRSETVPLASAQARVRARQKNRSESLFKLMLDAYNNGMKDVWANPDGLTPAQALESFGNDGAETIRRAGILKDAINAVVPGTLPASTTTTITAGADGSVTWPQGAATGTVAIVLTATGQATITMKP